MKGVFKIAGSKAKLADKIISLLPSATNFIEPFYGSGCVSLTTVDSFPGKYEKFFCNDANESIWSIHEYLKTNSKKFIEDIGLLFSFEESNSKENFIRNKITYNSSYYKGWDYTGALFYYLSHHCFNGLIRYNKKGEFNTPYANYKNVKFNREHLLKCAEIYQKDFVFFNHDYKIFLNWIANTLQKNELPRYISLSNSVIYCDPPYLPATKSNFSYCGINGTFNYSNHVELANLAEKLVKNNPGLVFAISNSYCERSLELYKNAKDKFVLSAYRSVASSADVRGNTKELLVIYS